MVDRAELRAQYRHALLTCGGLSTIPVLLVGVSWVMFVNPEPDGAGSGAIQPIMLIVFGIMALQPLVTVPLQRFVWGPRVMATQGQSQPELTIASLAITEYALWSISALMGFVVFFMGGTWLMFTAAIALTVVGWIISFPRWPDWVDRVDQLDQQALHRPVTPA